MQPLRTALANKLMFFERSGKLQRYKSLYWMIGFDSAKVREHDFNH